MTDQRIVFGETLGFKEAEHMYTWAGRPVPGVTTILGRIAKPMLIQWAANMASDYWMANVAGESSHASIHKAAKEAHRKKKEAAGSIGTNVHEYAEATFKNKELPLLLTDQAKRGVEAFHKWLDSYKVKVTDSELMVFSQEFHYAGTCDFIAEIDGELCVGDIKTSSGIYPEARFQTAAYQQAIQEERGVKFPARWIARFDKKTGDFEAKKFHDFDLDFQGFHSALMLHRTLQAI